MVSTSLGSASLAGSDRARDFQSRPLKGKLHARGGRRNNSFVFNGRQREGEADCPRKRSGLLARQLDDHVSRPDHSEVLPCPALEGSGIGAQALDAAAQLLDEAVRRLDAGLQQALRPRSSWMRPFVASMRVSSRRSRSRAAERSRELFQAAMPSSATKRKTVAATTGRREGRGGADVLGGWV